jgi:flavin reductase (NADH)
MGRRRAQPPSSAEFGAALDQRLRHLGLTPAAFAERAGLSVSHVYQLLRGDRSDPRGTTLRKIAAALGVSETQLATPPLPEPSSAGESSPSAEAIDRASFFALMSAFPTGVTIVSTLDELGQPRGLTCTMTCSVSADPPLLLVCIDKKSNTLPALRHSRRFVVNYLRAARVELSNRFATHSPGKWTDVAWKPTRHGMPCLHADSLAYAECRVVNEIDSGDHVIVVARVEGGQPPAPGTQPLIYFRRTYATFGPGGTS